MFMQYAAKRRKWKRANAAATAIMSVVTLAATLAVFLGMTGLSHAAPDDSARLALLLVAPDISLAPLPFSREAALTVLTAGLVAMSAGGVALARSLASDFDAATRRRF